MPDRPSSSYGITASQCSSNNTKDLYVGEDIGHLQKVLAPVTSADLFKSDGLLQRPRSTFDISGLLSNEARLRQPSSLKAGSAGLGKNIISLATGRPSSASYPFESLDLEFLDPSPDGHEQEKQTTHCIISRDDLSDSIDLSTALSYGYSLGHEQLIQFLTTHISFLHNPPYADWEVCLSCGNTSALEIALRNFTNPGDAILVEEYTYSGAIEAAKPLRLKLIPVPMDEHGLCPISLEEILLTWQDKHPDIAKPRVIYTIPTGHNPTGLTQPTRRRHEVLEVVERHELLLIEDDPYYYLQFPKTASTSCQALLPSYLSLCASGRVLRLDSTSKVLAPGLRLGWLTGPKSTIETFQASHDLGVVHPSGLSQAAVFKLLSQAWGHNGFFRWLHNLSQWYHNKARAAENALALYLGAADLSQICSWRHIEAGMFLWLKIDCTNHPIWQKLVSEDRSVVLMQIEDAIYRDVLEEGVVCCKGSFFNVLGEELGSERKVCLPLIHFRLTFACVDASDLGTAIEILSKAITASFGAI